ncbi:MAG: RDD family protein [Clostridium sp.]|nr:RDD family protein [Clostridium sp.]
MQYATKAARMGAFLIDGIVVGVAMGICCAISYVLGGLVMLAGQMLYTGIMEGSRMHATIGKNLMGIVTVDENGQPLDYGKSFTRAICRLLSGTVTLGVGFLIGLFDEEGKALHDRIAGTRVITKESMGMSAAAYGNKGLQQNGPQQAAPVRANTAAQPKLVGVAGRYAGQAYLIGPQGLMLGRDQSACDFVFDSSATGISRTHCKIQYNPQTGMFILYDLGSSYGTYLGNGVRVPQGQPMALCSGEQFYLADRGCMFMVSI